MKLQSREIVGRQPGPHLLITGGVHGDEFEPMAAARRLIYEIDPQRLRGRVTIVPVVNEPAFRRGERCGDDGLDLARTCPGKPDGTATEQIAFALSQLIRTADLYIDLHTGGTRLVVLPLSGYTLHPIPEVLSAQRRMARAFGLPIIWGTDPNLKGRSLSVAREANIPAIYAEYRGGGQFESKGVEAYVRGSLNVMAEFEMLERDSGEAPATSPLVVEDHRTGSGHMQINHPCATEGFFLPAVELGQRVSAGQTLGTICDPLGTQVETVQARYAGIVIVLHTFARVNAGTGIAVVLECNQ